MQAPNTLAAAHLRRPACRLVWHLRAALQLGAPLRAAYVCVRPGVSEQSTRRQLLGGATPEHASAAQRALAHARPDAPHTRLRHLVQTQRR